MYGEFFVAANSLIPTAYDSILALEPISRLSQLFFLAANIAQSYHLSLNLSRSGINNKPLRTNKARYVGIKDSQSTKSFESLNL